MSEAPLETQQGLNARNLPPFVHNVVPLEISAFERFELEGDTRSIRSTNIDVIIERLLPDIPTANPGKLYLAQSKDLLTTPTELLDSSWTALYGVKSTKVHTSCEKELPLGAFNICVLDGVIERVDDPAQLLAYMYDALIPEGLLLVSANDLRRAGRKRTPQTWERYAGLANVFPGDTLATLLFRQGFVGPRFHTTERGEYVITAHKSTALPPTRRPMSLSVILPAYNERATFPIVMARLLVKKIANMSIQIVVVEGNSTDGTREAALEYSSDPRVVLLMEDKPRGKGRAVRRGFEAATGDFILIQDGDLEYDFDDYERLLQPLINFDCGFVLGKRERSAGAIAGIRHLRHERFMSIVMNVGNAIFLGLFNFVYRQRLSDPFTMFKVFRRDCINGVRLECDRFDFDWELVAKLIRMGYSPREVPVSYRSRSFSEGKKISVLRDPLTWVVACFKYRFARLDA